MLTGNFPSLQDTQWWFPCTQVVRQAGDDTARQQGTFTNDLRKRGGEVMEKQPKPREDGGMKWGLDGNEQLVGGFNPSETY